MSLDFDEMCVCGQVLEEHAIESLECEVEGCECFYFEEVGGESLEDVKP